MKHWIDRTSESDNVIVANEISLLIGSSDKEHLERVESQLIQGTPVAEVLGSEDVKVIRFSQIQSLTAGDTDPDIDLYYRAKGEQEHESLVFEDERTAQTFMQFLDANLPKTLSRKTWRQSRIAAATMPAASLALCVGASALFIDKMHLPVYIVGGLWAAASIWMLVNPLKTPPTITRWSREGRHIRKAMSALKTGFAFALAALIVTGVSLKMPDRFGERAVHDALLVEGVSAEDVRAAVARGGNVNYVNADGATLLGLAVFWDDTDAAVALVESGANLAVDASGLSALETALDNGANARVISAIIARGGLAYAQGNGFDPYKHVEQYGDYYDESQLAALFSTQIGAAKP